MGRAGPTSIQKRSVSLGRSIILTYVVFFLLFLSLSEFIVWKSLKYLALRSSKAYLETLTYRGSLILRDYYADYLLSTNPSQGVFPREMFLLKRTLALEDLEDFFENQGISFAIWLNGNVFASSWKIPPQVTLRELKEKLRPRGILIQEIHFKPFQIEALVGMDNEQALRPFREEIEIYLTVGIFFALAALGITYALYHYLIGYPLKRLTNALSSGNLPEEIGIREFDHLIRMVKKALDRERKLVESLAVSEKLAALGTLAGGYAHEFNNLLQIILGNVEVSLLACRNKACAKAQQKLLNIKETSLRGAALARKILAISRQEKEQNISTCDLGKILREMEDGLRRGFPRETSFSVEVQDNLVVPLAPEQIRDIIVNLVSNARDALTGPGNVRIRAYDQGHEVVLEVSDTGIGMDEETQKRIFDPFFTTKEPGKGTGLGLYAVYQLTNMARGRIELETKPQKGTTFRIFLPKTSCTSPPETDFHSVEKDSASRKLRILVVDDEKEILESFKELLSAEGHQVFQAPCAEEAWKTFLKLKDIDLVFLDLSMPGKGGQWLLEKLIIHHRPPRIVLMTGFTGKLSQTLSRLKEEGKIFRLLDKPFDWKQIKKILKEVGR